MKKSIWFWCAAILLVPQCMPAQTIGPLSVNPVRQQWQPLPLGSVQPRDWLKTQMQRNLGRFTGNLDSLVPDLIVQDDIYNKQRLSAKSKIKDLGAKSEDGAWQVQFLWWNSETQSNWMDGLIRTAVLLNDTAMLAKAKAWVKRMLASQDADGYLGIYDPALRYRFRNENGELWSKTTLYRALLSWYEFSKDKRVMQAVERGVRNVMVNWPVGKAHPFVSDNPNVSGLSHGLVFTDVLEELYAISGNREYLQYVLFLYNDFSRQVLNEDAQLNKLLDSNLALQGHGVHTYEHLRSVAAAYYASGNDEMYRALRHYIQKIERASTPSGGPAGDEFVRGRQGHTSLTGYEYCSLHELMAGWLSLMQKSGDGRYGQAAEHLVFNAALGAIHPQEGAICYLKTDNSLQLTGGKNGDTTDPFQTRYRYSPTHREAAVCCVPNAGRLFAYFTQHLWMRDADGLVAGILGPCEVKTQVKGTAVSIEEKTTYPFETQITFLVKTAAPVRFAIKVRRPSWASGVLASLPYHKQHDLIVFDRVWKTGDTMNIRFEHAPQAQLCNEDQEVYFSDGPLVLCRPIESNQVLTRQLALGMQESNYVPQHPAGYSYTGASPVALPGGRRYQIQLWNEQTAKAETVDLVPMSWTILRQVSFAPRKE